MQKQNPIDDLFRRKLSDYKVTPSSGRRDDIIRDAMKGVARQSAPRWWIIGTGAGLLIMAGVGYLFHEQRQSEKLTSLNSKYIENYATNNIKSSTADNSIISIKRSIPVNEKTVQPKITTNNTELKPKENNEVRISEPTKNRGIHNQLKLATEQPLKLQKASIKPSVSPGTESVSPPISPKSEAVVPPVSSKTDTPPSPSPGTEVNVSTASPESATVMQTVSERTKKDSSFTEPSHEQQFTMPESSTEEKTPVVLEKKRKPKTWGIEAGLSYTPEWMFNTFNHDKFVNNPAIEGIIHFGPFSLRTGLGLSIMTGSNELNVQTNTYLGAYSSLDSIVFKWDQNHYKLLSYVYTSSQNAYDTSLSNNYLYNKKRFTYLQVPLILGYDFWQDKWFSIGIRAGAIISILLNTENISGEYEAGQNRIITISNVTPGRIQMNWQETGGINAKFRLSSRFSVEVEPDVRYYFNSIYESSGPVKKPWSVGLRIAFLIKL
jgi:hypothetical protein